MKIDYALSAALVACGAVLCSMAMQWRTRRSISRRGASVLEAFGEHRTVCAEQFEELRRNYSALEASLQSTRDVLRHGRFNRSRRAEALQMLRSGMSAETAASALGIAGREIKLLAKVSKLLTAN